MSKDIEEPQTNDKYNELNYSKEYKDQLDFVDETETPLITDGEHESGDLE